MSHIEKTKTYTGKVIIIYIEKGNSYFMIIYEHINLENQFSMIPYPIGYYILFHTIIHLHSSICYILTVRFGAYLLWRNQCQYHHTLLLCKYRPSTLDMMFNIGILSFFVIIETREKFLRICGYTLEWFNWQISLRNCIVHCIRRTITLWLNYNFTWLLWSKGK